MKHSIRKKMLFFFTGLIVCLILVLLIINVWSLEPVYIRNKERAFCRMYTQLNSILEKGDFKEGREIEAFQREAEKYNLSFLILDETGGRVVTNVRDMDMLREQLFGYLINRNQKDSRLLRSTETYQIVQSRDVKSHIEYIEMWGSCVDGARFLFRSPIESIKESAEISNRFLIWLGCAAIVICALIVWIYSTRITKPLQELAVLSKRMAGLDFEAKYTSGGDDEIGQLGESFNEMSKKLENTISELKRANNSLKNDIRNKEKREQMRSEFMGNVSHELKTPIALIQGYAEGLRDGIVSDPSGRKEYCEVIMDEAAKMNVMVKNLMTLNQLEFGEDVVDFQRFDLTELIRGVIQSMEILAEQNGATLQFGQKEAVYVWADAFRIEQVVRNYLSNAYNHLGGDKVVEIRIRPEDTCVCVSVFNTGTPIPQEDIPRIWEKFYKVDKSHTRAYGGNGIGLSIVKAIMESHHQQYGVKNFDNGVEFWFTVEVQ